jgi:hypothetical protein
MKKRIAAALMALLLIVCPLWALFGIGDIVYDPTLYANAILMLAELIKSYDQLKAEYELQVWLAKTVPVDMSTRYRTVGAAWYGLQLPYDRFGNLGGWVDAVNHGGNALGGYGGASIELRPYGSRFSQLTLDEQRKSASQYASAELADGINVHSMETIGMLRGNAPAVDRAIQGLENDSLSLDPAMNTEIAVLNKINAAAIANLRSTRDTNRALLSALEQQVTDSKRRRDAEVSEINTQIMRLERGDEAKAENTSTLTDSVRSFRWK